MTILKRVTIYATLIRYRANVLLSVFATQTLSRHLMELGVHAPMPRRVVMLLCLVGPERFVALIVA